MKQETIHHYPLPIAAMFAHSVYVAFLLIVKFVKIVCPHNPSPYFRDTHTFNGEAPQQSNHFVRFLFQGLCAEILDVKVQPIRSHHG